MATDLDPQKTPRRRQPLRILLGAILVLFILPILGWLVWGWVEGARLDRTLDALETRREPLDIAAFDPKPTTAEQRQASHLYAQAGKLTDNSPVTMEQATALSKTIERACSSNVAASERNAQARVLADFEHSYPPVFDLLEQASRLDASGWDEGDGPQRQSMQEMRPITLARANAVRIARLACTGDGDGAARALLASLRLRRVWVGGQIAPIAMQTAHSLQSLLTWTQPSPALLDELEKEYLAAADPTRFQNWMVRERAVWLSYAMPGVFSDAPRGSADRRMTPVEAVSRRLVRPLHDRRLVQELDEFDAAIEIAKQPWTGKLDAIDEFSEARPSRRSLSTRPGLIDILSRPLGSHIAANALAGYIGGMTETLARNRASAAAIAVARHQRDHSGACPQQLQQVVPQYMPSQLTDPFSGTDLKFRCDVSGFTVYSIGANRKDDGGTWEQHSDLQLARRGNPLDLGIVVESHVATSK